MRVLWLCLLGLLAYAVSVIFLFPAAPVVDYFKPRLNQIELNGVDGKLYSGSVASVKYTDDLLPLEFSNVAWKLAPRTLLKGGTGMTISYDGYGGGGSGEVLREWDGDIAVTDFEFTADAKALETLLPVPIAQFEGKLNGTLNTVVLKNQQLATLDGVITWADALLEAPVGSTRVRTALGVIDITVQPEGSGAHIVTIKAQGGDVNIDGKVSLAANGDFSADVLLVPAATASPGVINGLRQIARPEPGGKFRLKQSGNINKLM
jgi:hypothetical protein